ncbi:hypothetical protein [Nonomuraea sp. NPDC049784]|uniref:hypothetical protein n=1 Tax=Nonomuraea sp. NPDC049784 TaxID=3154361 RepID=UPI0033FA8434
MTIPHSGEQPGSPFCGVGHRDAVPYVEALAFWGRAVEQRLVPRSYALTVLVDHPLLLNTAVWQGPEPPSRWERLWAAVDDLADWENIVVEMSLEPGDFFDFLREEQQLLGKLAQLPVEIAACEEQLEGAQSEHVSPQPHHGDERPASTRE